ncbi:MAG: hypothetical protein K2I19_05740 [Muribaculaceae bacterium]|nr:hypothetical protein [Muribaculaceae bacterium]
MEKLLKYLMLALVATFSLTFSACSGEENDEPDNKPSTSDSVISGSASSNYTIDFVPDDYYSPNFRWENDRLYYNNRRNSGYDNCKFVSVGKVSRLSDIKTAPTSGWANSGSSLELIDSGGYIFTYTYGGIPYYVRLYITLNTSIDGTVVGINYSFQNFTPSNL